MESNIKEEINRLIVWSANLQPLNVSQCKKVAPKIKKWEIFRFIWRYSKFTKSNKKEKFKRRKLIDYDNKEHFTDWEKYDEYNKYEKIPDKIVGVLDQQNVETDWSWKYRFLEESI